MAMATRQPPIRPATADWVPSPLARLTVDQYEAMVDSGVFTEQDRFQLINGLLVAKLPKKRPHVIACDETSRLLTRIIPRGWHVMTEDPVCIPPKSEPEPDVAVVRGKPRDYPIRPPGPKDLAMVVEIADRTVAKDRQMARVYGPAEIPVYWIVNLKSRQVEVYTGPCPDGYASRSDFVEGQTVPVVIKDVEVGRIAVDDILPNRGTGKGAKK
jgi:Uma2 family endonuclease